MVVLMLLASMGAVSVDFGGVALVVNECCWSAA